MSANSDNPKQSRAAQLADLANRLNSQVDNESVLAEIHVAIKKLLSNNSGGEAHIRQILQKRFDAGDLRPESVELVQKMLDRIQSEKCRTCCCGFHGGFESSTGVAESEHAWRRQLDPGRST